MHTVDQPAGAGLVGNNPIRRIATLTNINGNSLAATSMVFDSSLSLSNALPCFVVLKYKSGTFSLAIARIQIGSGVMSALIALNGLAANKAVLANLLTTGVLVDLTSALQVEVTTVNGSAATFDVDIFGAVY